MSLSQKEILKPNKSEKSQIGRVMRGEVMREEERRGEERRGEVRRGEGETGGERKSEEK